MRATTIDGQNPFAPTLWFAQVYVIDGQNTRDQITSDKRSKRAWSEVVQTKLVTYVPSMRTSNQGPVVRGAISANPGLNFSIFLCLLFYDHPIIK